MMKVLSVSVEKGYLINVSALSDEEISVLKERIYDNNIDLDNLEGDVNFTVKTVRYEAQV